MLIQRNLSNVKMSIQDGAAGVKQNLYSVKMTAICRAGSGNPFPFASPEDGSGAQVSSSAMPGSPFAMARR